MRDVGKSDKVQIKNLGTVLDGCFGVVDRIDPDNDEDGGDDYTISLVSVPKGTSWAIGDPVTIKRFEFLLVE
jgi:hypothetical protein